MRRVEECDLIPKEFVVQLPALQVINWRGLVILVGALHDEQAKEIRPGRLVEGCGRLVEPHLMLVALVVGRALYDFRWTRKVTLLFASVLLEDLALFPEIG